MATFICQLTLAGMSLPFFGTHPSKGVY